MQATHPLWFLSFEKKPWAAPNVNCNLYLISNFKPCFLDVFPKQFHHHLHPPFEKRPSTRRSHEDLRQRRVEDPRPGPAGAVLRHGVADAVEPVADVLQELRALQEGRPAVGVEDAILETP